MPSLSVDEARRLLWEAWPPGPTVRRPLLEAMLHVTAENMLSDMDFPPFDRVAMDGYAVRAADTADAPVRLPVVGVAAAGAPFGGRLEPGQAVKAMTGACLPAGADAVVKVEDTSGWSDREVEIRHRVQPGRHFAPRAQDLAAGEVVLEAGTVLAPHHVQALASAGHAAVPVIEPPTAVVFSTGDELVPMERRPGPGRIRESNGPCVRAILAEWAVRCVDGGFLGDRTSVLEERLGPALARHEVVVLSGGVSMGEKDLVKPVLRALGVDLIFENLHLRPGHPATFGRHRGGVVFALPGNPVSVFVTLQAVFSAGLRRRLGQPRPAPPCRWGVLGFDVIRKGNRPMYLPVKIEESLEPGPVRLASTGHHGSGDFRSLARASALAWLPEDRERFPAGAAVEILPLGPDLRG